MYEIIDGKRLKIKEPPGFYPGGLTEKDYLKLVQESQDYIAAGDLDDRQTRICNKSAHTIWVDPCNAVVVERDGSKYRVTNNGNHRAYVAHKYKLKLLVYIDDDAINGNAHLF